MDEKKRNAIVAGLRLLKCYNAGQMSDENGDPLPSSREIDDLIDDILHSENHTAKVLITQKRGVTDYIFDGDVEVRTFDFDAFKDDPDSVEHHLPAHFDDLAKAMHIPVSVVAPLTMEYEHEVLADEMRLLN